MNLYTIVTNDEYELPVKCDVKIKEAADFLGTTPGNVRNMLCKPRKKSKYRVIVTGKVGFDARAYNKRYAMTHDRSKYFRERYRRMKGEERNNRERVPT